MNEDFLAVNRKTIEGTFIAVHVTPHSKNDGGNSDEFRVTINTGDQGGQSMKIFGRLTDFVSFTIVGVHEMAQLPELLKLALEQIFE